MEAQLARARSTQQEELLTQVSFCLLVDPPALEQVVGGNLFSARLQRDELLVRIVICFGHSTVLQPQSSGSLKYERFLAADHHLRLFLTPARPDSLAAPMFSCAATVSFWYTAKALLSPQSCLFRVPPIRSNLQAGKVYPRQYRRLQC